MTTDKTTMIARPPQKKYRFEFTVLTLEDYNGEAYFVAVPTANVGKNHVIVDPCGVGSTHAEAIAQLINPIFSGGDA